MKQYELDFGLSLALHWDRNSFSKAESLVTNPLQ